ncbi:MAG: CNNM domain-containing protein [Phycisphaerales bacterium]
MSAPAAEFALPEWAIDPALVAMALAGLSASAVFSGLEIGIYTLNRVKLTVAAETGRRDAIALRRELERPEGLLATLLVGNNIVNYLGTFAIALLLDRAGLGPFESVLVNTAVVVPLLLVFGEILPKDLFRTFTDRWTYRFAGMLVLLRRLLSAVGVLPLLRLVGAAAMRLTGGRATQAGSAAQRIGWLFREGAKAGVLSGEQISLVDRALEMRRRTVIGEMTPWSRVATLRDDAPAAARTRVVRERAFSRFPVVDAQGRVRGVIQALDAILDPSAPTSTLVRPAETLSPDLPATEAIRLLRQKRARLAIVARPGGKPLGVVGLKDLIEPLTGDLRAW